MTEISNRKLVAFAVAALMVACSPAEEHEDPDFSMRYEICREAYAGPIECPEVEIEGLIAVE